MRFSNYYNHEGRNRNIYSRNNLLGMTMKELLERELELAYQYNTIGIPADEELLNSEFAHQYQDENGFSHWQAGPNPSMQSIDKETLSNQELSQRFPKESSTESAPSTNNQLQGFGVETNSFAQQKKNTEFPNLGTFLPNNEKHFMVDFQSDLNKNMQQKEKSPEEQAKQNLQKYVPLEDTGYTDEPYLTYEDLLGDEIEEEKLAREQKEIETFDKLFEEELNKNDKPQNAEPYLTYEELLGFEPQSENTKEVPPTEEMLRKQMEENGVPTGGASGIQENWDKNGKIYYTDENGRKINPNFQDKAKELWDILVNNKTDYSKDITAKEKFIDFAVKNPITRALYPASSDIYTDGMTNFSRAKQNLNAQILDNYLGLDENTRTQLINYGVNQNHKGVHYNENSEISKIIANSPEIKQVILENKDLIKSGQIKDIPFEFQASKKDMLSNKEKFDRANSIQHGKLWNIKINDDNSYTAQLGDLVDYAQRDVKSLSDFMNNHGYNMQEKKNFENYFILMNLKSYLDEDEFKRRKNHR